MHFSEGRIYLDEGLMGFADKLAQQKIVQTRLDLLLIGAAYAIRERIPPMEKFQRHELTRVSTMDDDRQVLVKAVLPSYAREVGLEIPEDDKALLELLGRTGSAGLRRLKNEWEHLSSSQIRSRLFQLSATPA